MVAPLAALNPEFTVRALLEFLAFDKVKESGFYLLQVDAAVQTVMLRAEWAAELFAFFVPRLVVDEGKFTVSRRTPRKVLLCVNSCA